MWHESVPPLFPADGSLFGCRPRNTQIIAGFFFPCRCLRCVLFNSVAAVFCTSFLFRIKACYYGLLFLNARLPRQSSVAQEILRTE